MYVSDRLAGTIYVYDRDGAYQRELTLAVPRPGWQPLGLAFDKAGNLYVTDLSGPYQKVLVIDRTANVVRTLGENEQAQLPERRRRSTAPATCTSPTATTAACSCSTPSGTIVGQVGRGTGEGNLGLPRGVAVDGQGRVFVADATGQGVFVYRAPSGDEPPPRVPRLRRRRGGRRTRSSRTPTASRSTRAVACTWQTRSTIACRSGATEAPGNDAEGGDAGPMLAADRGGPLTPNTRRVRERR